MRKGKCLNPMTQSCDCNVVLMSHTSDGFVQVLGLLSVLVIELTEHSIQGIWIRTIQDEMLQKPGE